MQRAALFILTGFLLFSQAALAASSCNVSASVTAHDYPGAQKIPTTNNLMLPTGKAVEADGQKLIIHGRLRDSHCAPVPEATVELWQNNPYGRFLLAQPRDLATPNAMFAGAGRTYTNSNGEFTFITAFPAPSRYATPSVNIKINADHMDSYMSALFFSGDERNEKDASFKKLSLAARDDVMIHVREGEGDGLVGNIDIVLPGKAAYRTY